LVYFIEFHLLELNKTRVFYSEKAKDQVVDANMLIWWGILIPLSIKFWCFFEGLSKNQI